MLIFKGDYSIQCKKQLNRESLNYVLILMAIVFPFFLCFIAILCWCFVDMIFFIIPCGGISIISVGMLIYIGHITNMPNQIIININENSIYYDNTDMGICKSLSGVKSVFDMGTYYYIKFSTIKNTPIFICQKDLIVQGTIEEFEELFKDKIIRKY